MREFTLVRGKDRDTANSVPTDHKFTGQKLDGSGLMYYGARFYDPQTGLFVSPDTIVPDPGRVFAYNRTMYVYGNPLLYSDPNGHQAECMAMQTGEPMSSTALVLGCQASNLVVRYGPTIVQLASQWADKVPAMWDAMFSTADQASHSGASNSANSGNSSTGNPNDWDPNKYQGTFRSAAERYQYQTSRTLLNQQTRLNITRNGASETVDVDGIVNNFIHESKFIEPASNFYSKQIGKSGLTGLELHVKGWGDLLQRQSLAAQQLGYSGVKVFTNNQAAKEMAIRLFGDKDWFKMIEIINEAAK